MENAKSKQILIALLHFMRDCELDKPLGESNEELVDACVCLLLKLQGKTEALTTEQIEDRVRKIPFVISADFDGEANKKVKKHTTKKKILLVAAIIAILCALLAVFSIGYNLNYWHSVMNDVFGSVHNVPVDEVFGNENEEYGSYGKSFSYDDIDDFRRKEKINILLPSDLPEGISITRIVLPKSQGTIFLVFNSYITSYEIHLNTPLSKDMSTDLDSYTTDNGILCYIEKIDETNIVQIYFENNGNTYIISGTDEQLLLDIINNLE